MKAQIKIGNCIISERAGRWRADSKFSPPLKRMREIEAVITDRHGQLIPETDDADIYIRAAALSRAGQDLAGWCARWAPWAEPILVSTIEAETADRRRMLGPDAVANLLMVTMAERDRLDLRTIGACDLPRAERLKLARARKRERDRQRQAEQRSKTQGQDRQSYEAQSLSRAKPWQAEGISRRTWERRRVASPSRVEEERTGDTLATIGGGEGCRSAHVQSHRAPPARVRGSGTTSPTGFGAAPHGIRDKEGTAA